MKTMYYRLIVLNLDDTLLPRQKRILPESLTALRQAHDAGLQVMVVTGPGIMSPFTRSIRRWR